MYSPRSYAHVYCRECWYSDNWDPMSYGRTYDPSQSFRDQLGSLLREVPFFNLYQIGENVNSHYCNIVYNSKDSYLSFSNVRSEGSLYCKSIDDGRDCTDCFVATNSELLYDCVSVKDSYKSVYLTRSEKCSECYFGRDLVDCQNCFGCVNLKHKQWYWYNEKVSEEEYRLRLTAALQDRKSFEAHKEHFNDFSHTLPAEYATIRQSEDATGNAITNSRAIRSSFFIADSENTGECFRLIWNSKDCYRESYGGQIEHCYNSVTLPFSSHSFCSFSCDHCSFIFYSAFCLNSDSLFGCVGLRKKKFCILNTQYSEDEYKELSARIIADMKLNGEWGEFLQSEHNFFSYNDTLGYEYFPLKKEEVIARGMQWEDEQGGASGKETLSLDKVSDRIEEIDESIIKEILACESCGVNYTIIKKELERLKTLRIPLPLHCPDCRYKKRFDRSIVPVLYDRHCMCEQDHTLHQGGQCPNQFQTTYRPDGKDIVYCSPCYQECVQ